MRDPVAALNKKGLIHPVSSCLACFGLSLQGFQEAFKAATGSRIFGREIPVILSMTQGGLRAGRHRVLCNQWVNRTYTVTVIF